MAKPTPDANADYCRSAHSTLDQLIEQTERLHRSIEANARKPKAVRQPRRRSWTVTARPR